MARPKCSSGDQSDASWIVTNMDNGDTMSLCEDHLTEWMLFVLGGQLDIDSQALRDMLVGSADVSSPPQMTGTEGSESIEPAEGTEPSLTSERPAASPTAPDEASVDPTPLTSRNGRSRAGAKAPPTDTASDRTTTPGEVPVASPST